MRIARPARVRRVSGWALYLGLIALVRLVGLGSAPPGVGAAPVTEDEAAVDVATSQATAAHGWLLADLDVSGFAEATQRCLAAGPRCTSDDVLAVDTTRDRLASLATALAQATDPADPGYLGEPDAATARRAAAVRPAAADAAEALAGFLSTGCAGSVDGVAVEQPPADCDAVSGRALDALERFAAALAGPGEEP